MEFYEDYIPLNKLYPYTLAPRRSHTTSTPVMVDSSSPDSIIVHNNFVPKPSESKDWKALVAAHGDFMESVSGLSAKRKVRAMENYCDLWVRSRFSKHRSRF